MQKSETRQFFDAFVKVIIPFLLLMILLFWAGFIWLIPYLEKRSDERFIERQYEREEYRHKIECERNLKPKSECKDVTS